MRRRDFLRQLGWMAVAGAAPGLGCGTLWRPNAILINVDDLGWTDLGCYGSTYYETPNIDRLCAEGIKFTDAYASAAVCSPTRSALMTGRYPARTGITDWLRPPNFTPRTIPAPNGGPGRYVDDPDRAMLCPMRRQEMPPGETTIAEVLRQVGYATAHIGKWHLGRGKSLPEYQGFDVNKGGSWNGQPPSYWDPYEKGRLHGLHGLPAREPGEYLTDREASEAVAFIRAHRERPFFLNLWHYAVHTPMHAKDELIRKYRDRITDDERRDRPVYGAMLESVDQAVGAVLAALDERRRKRRVESQLAHAERLAGIGTLAAGVAHEVNNPLAYVSLNVEATIREAERLARELARGSAAAEEGQPWTIDLGVLEGLARSVAGHAAAAAQGTQRVKDIVVDLMTFSRVRSDETQSFDVNEAVDIAVKMALHEIKYRARLEAELGEVAKVVGNAGRLSQVVLNLLLNAARAIEEGRPDDNAVRVRTAMEGDEVVLSVEDTGRGIREDDLARIFEPFFTRRGLGSGVGLGLSVCRDIVSAHGGHIEVRSEVGRGTTFVVRMPASAADASAPDRADDEPGDEPGDEVAAPAARGRVLIVDDEPMVRSVLAKLLGRRFEVEVASGCAEAIAALQQEPPPDAVVCDMMMLDGTGMDVHRWAREHRPTLLPRMVFATGGSFTPTTSEFLRDVAPHRIEKPFRLRELERLLDLVLAQA